MTTATVASEAEAGPFSTFKSFGREVPVYLLAFDDKGRCTSPRSARDLLSRLEAGRGREVILYSHGWNNDFPTAMESYQAFLSGLSGLSAANEGSTPDGFDPVFVGIVWPSTALTFGDENAPDLAAASVERLDELTGGRAAEAGPLLNARGGIDEAGAERLARLIAPQVGDERDPEQGGSPVSPQDLVAAWQAGPGGVVGRRDTGSFDDFGEPARRAGPPTAAGWLGLFDPRWILRVATVLQMKSRAGLVGRGLGDVVRDILALKGPRLYLVGHSYGAKVIMSALAVEVPPRPAKAVLLLQPAISHLCFATDVGGGAAGGFRSVLERVRKPVVATFSRHDLPLTRLYHLATRRATDLGELQPLGAPSRFAALGGFGPSECGPGECVVSSFVSPPRRYDWPDQPVRVVALDGEAAIFGHGDVSNPFVFWAMLNLLR